MQKTMIGKKIGMTQIFDETGKVIPVTGNKPTTTPKLIITCTPIKEIIPMHNKQHL